MLFGVAVQNIAHVGQRFALVTGDLFELIERVAAALEMEAVDGEPELLAHHAARFPEDFFDLARAAVVNRSARTRFELSSISWPP